MNRTKIVAIYVEVRWEDTTKYPPEFRYNIIKSVLRAYQDLFETTAKPVSSDVAIYYREIKSFMVQSTNRWIQEKYPDNTSNRVTKKNIKILTEKAVNIFNGLNEGDFVIEKIVCVHK